MPIETPTTDLVRQLSRVGLRPDERLVKRIVEQGDAAREALLRLATDIEALHTELPGALGPLHALRLLGELPDVAIITPLLKALPIPIYSEEDVPAHLYANEALQIIGRVGIAAIPVLWAFADDETNTAMSRAAAVSALSYIAVFAPESREDILAESRKRLETEQAPSVLAGLISTLADLADTQSYKPVMALYRDGKVDKEITPAATTRQFMLGGGRKNLTCVNHALFERYDHHGPTYSQFNNNNLDDDYDDDY